MPSLRIAIGDILTDPDEPDDLTALSTEEAEARLKEVYGFLGAGVDVSVDRGVATISVPDAEADRAARAKRLYTRAVQAAGKGQYERAATRLRDVLRVLPLDMQARRNLAMSQMEAGDGAAAKKHVIETLRLNPKDAWAFVILGNLHAQVEQDLESAERSYEAGLVSAPDDVFLLNSYAAVKAKQGHLDEARTLFEKAISTDPSYPNPRLGVALCLMEEQEDEQALEQLERMFAAPESDDPRAEPVHEQGRGLYLELSQQLAQANHAEIAEKLQEVMDDFSAETGYPIEVQRDNTINVSATTKLAWVYGRRQHIIQYKTTEPAIQPHLVAHEFGHIELAHEARAADRGMLFSMPDSSRESALRSLLKHARKMLSKGYSQDMVDTFLDQIVTGLANQLYNVPLDMVIEERLYDRHEFLRPSQVVSLHATQLEHAQVVTDKSIRDISPPKIYRANVTMNCAYALFTDLLLNGATRYAEAYRASGVLPMAQKLVSLWEDAMSEFQPGDESKLVDEVARALRLQEWYEWRPDKEGGGPGEAAERGAGAPLEGPTNVELLKEKETAVVALCLRALRRFEKMDDGEVLAITSEIALLGRSGLDYASSEHKYTLRSLPGERFSGLGLMCLMHVGLQRIDPSVDSGMPFAEEYSRAVEIYRSEK